MFFLNSITCWGMGKSSIDSQYTYQRRLFHANKQQSNQAIKDRSEFEVLKLEKKIDDLLPPSTVVASNDIVRHFYKNYLAKTMFSRCDWYPSDSQYLNLVSRRCGQAIGLTLAVSRFMMEADANRISGSWVNDQGHLRFEWYGNYCIDGLGNNLGSLADGESKGSNTK